MATSYIALQFATALGIGLLIGAERERRKGVGPRRSPEGIRTFAIASLLGAASIHLGGELMLAVTFGGVAILCAIGYLQSRGEDPGLTTEIALLLTVLLGATAMRSPAIASALAVAVAALLAARAPLHHFVRDVLSEDELADALIFAAATLVVLPLVPDRYLGPFGAINPRTIWKIVVLMMTISGAGYVAVRLLGPRFGLPLAGFASGFVSSIATIGAMGARVKQEPALTHPAVAGAALSTVATVVQMTILLAATNRATLSAMSTALLAAGVGAAAYGVIFTVKSLRHQAKEDDRRGRAFSLKSAVGFAVMIALMLLAAAALNAWLGRAGLLAGAALAGFADTHSAAVSVASLVAAGKVAPHDALVPILAALTTNTISKMIFAITAGGRSFALHIIPGLLLVIAAAWLGAVPALFQ